MSALMSAAGSLLMKHGPVLFGLVVGTIAKFGRMMVLGIEFNKKQVVGHCLMMAMIGLVATMLVDLSNITNPNARAFTAAVLAIAASDVIKYLATRAWRKFLNDANEERGDLRNLVQTAVSARNLLDDAGRPKGEGDSA